MPVHLIIDGYNLIRRSPSLAPLDRADLEVGREELIRRLALYRQTRSLPITVVFDGSNQRNLPTPRTDPSGIRVIFSRMGQKADDVIIRMAREIGDGALVVTSDREIQREAERHHATVIASEDFEQKMAMAFLMNQRASDSDDSDDQPEIRGTRKKGPSRRLPKKLRKARKRAEKL